MTNEIWLPVIGWERLYEVSSEGRVRSLQREVVVIDWRSGKPYSYRLAGKLLALTGAEYLHVTLSHKGQTLCCNVHDLVTAAFIGAKPDGLEVLHGDGIKTNNTLDNLRYGTRSENAMDRHAHGTMLDWKGEEVPSAKLTEQEVLEIRRCEGVFTQRELGGMYGVCHKTVHDIHHRKQWTHL